MSAKVLLITFVLLKYLESRHFPAICFSSGMSPYWSEQGGTATAPSWLRADTLIWNIFPVSNFTAQKKSSQQPCKILLGHYRAALPQVRWPQCLVAQRYWPHISLSCVCLRMAGNQFSEPTGKVCPSENMKNKNSTKSSFWDWWLKEFCHLPHSPPRSQKALADLAHDTAQGSSERGIQEYSAASALENADSGHE